MFCGQIIGAVVNASLLMSRSLYYYSRAQEQGRSKAGAGRRAGTQQVTTATATAVTTAVTTAIVKRQNVWTG